MFKFGLFYCFEQKGAFTTNPNFHLHLLLFKLVEKKLHIISELRSEIFIFLIKREFFIEIAQKFFKTTEKHTLAVCGSFCGEKQFLFIFGQFYCFEQKGFFTSNLNFPLDITLLKLVKKKILIISDFLSEIFFF